MIRSHSSIQSVVRSCRSVVAASGRTTLVGSNRHSCLHPLRKNYHSTTTHRSGDETSTRTSWSELLTSKLEKCVSETEAFERPSWSEEWKRLGLGADLVEDNGSTSTSTSTEDKLFPKNLFFVQLGFGVDQHGSLESDGFATKAAIRAVRNAIEFNSIPGVIDHLPGGRKQMLIHVKLGVPSTGNANSIDALEVAKVFPYGRLLPIQVVRGGLKFHSGRVVEELGDENDVGICCVACVSIGYNKDNDDRDGRGHKTHSTKDGH